MADYLSILKKTIDGLPNNSKEIRQAVYRKARTTIETQLRGFNPPLGSGVIGAQLQSLEEAILIAETEYATAAMRRDEEITLAMAEPASGPRAQELDEGLEVDGSNPDKVFPHENLATSPGGTSPSGDLAPSGDIGPSGDIVPSAGTTPSGDIVPSGDIGQAPLPTPQVAQKRYIPLGRARAREVDSEPSTAWDDGLDGSQTRPGSHKIRRYMMWFALFLMFAGGGAGLWFKRASLEPMVMSWISDRQTGSETGMADPSVSQEEPVPGGDSPGGVKKDEVKLSGESGEFPQEDVPIANLQPSEKPVELVEPGSASADPQAGGQEDQPVQEVADTATSTQLQTPGNEPLPIGEMAYLYEEGDAGTDATRANASVAWSTKMESLSQGLPEELVVVASMDVPEKALSMEMEIKRNVDVSISASHIIEIRFQVPEGFSGAGIDNISRFVLKSMEEARGEPLVAVPVKISDGFFLIAMDNLPQAVDVNTQLLLESSWIDMPISYSTGKRALVTLAKGDTGNQVFKDAFADWQNR